MANTVHDNPAKQRFELDLDGRTAFAQYRLNDGVFHITHTEVPQDLNGKGFGSELVRGSLDLVRARALKVKPHCPFVSAYIAKHPEYADLVS